MRQQAARGSAGCSDEDMKSALFIHSSFKSSHTLSINSLQDRLFVTRTVNYILLIYLFWLFAANFYSTYNVCDHLQMF